MLAHTCGCPIAVPEGEAQLIRESDTRGLWLDFADRQAEPFVVNQELVCCPRDNFS